MNTSRNILIAAAAAISFAAVASSANAQATVTGTGTASVQILKALSVTTASTLNFGKVAVATTGGTLTMDESGNRTPGTGAALVGGATGTATPFVFNGEKGQVVSVHFTNSGGTTSEDASHAATYTLNGPNSATVSLKVTSSAIDGSTKTLDATSGDLSVPVGGTITMGASQAGGSYTGSYYVTVSYN